MKQRVAARQLREHGRQMRRAEGQRRCNPQAAAQVAGRQDRFPRYIDLGADPRGVLAERDPGFGERGAAGGSCQKLDAQFLFQPEQPPTDDRLRDAEPASGRRDAAGIGHFDESVAGLRYPTSAFHFLRHSLAIREPIASKSRNATSCVSHSLRRMSWRIFWSLTAVFSAMVPFPRSLVEKLSIAS